MTSDGPKFSTAVFPEEIADLNEMTDARRAIRARVNAQRKALLAAAGLDGQAKDRLHRSGAESCKPQYENFHVQDWKEWSLPGAAEPPRLIDVGTDPEIARRWEVIYTPTGDVVPYVFMVDLDKGEAWQYVVTDHRFEMDGLNRKTRRVTGDLRLSSIPSNKWPPTHLGYMGILPPNGEPVSKITGFADEAGFYKMTSTFGMFGPDEVVFINRDGNVYKLPSSNEETSDD